MAAAPAPDLFPRFRALRGGQAAAQAGGDPQRFTRWLSPLPGGRVPSDEIVVHWAQTWPPHAPLLSGRGSSATYFPPGVEEPDGLCLRPGQKGGAINIYLKKNGKVVLSGSHAAQERLLSAIDAWTLPWGAGAPPTVGRPNLPPYPVR